MKNSNKKVLKSIVKECLLEILAEGLIGNNTASKKQSRELRGTLQETHERNQTEDMLSSTSQRSSYLDKVKMDVSQPREKSNRGISNKALQRVASITSDPVMSEILADTAATTLQEQRESATGRMQPSMSNADKASRIVNANDPSALFGESASKWANLAFAPSIRK